MIKRTCEPCKVEIEPWWVEAKREELFAGVQTNLGGRCRGQGFGGDLPNRYRFRMVPSIWLLSWPIPVCTSFHE